MLDFFTLIVKRHSNKTTYTSVSMSLRLTTISSSSLFDYTSRDYLLAANHQIDGTRIDLAPVLIMLTLMYKQWQRQCVQNAIILQSCQTHVFRLWGVNFTFVNVNCHEKCELGLKTGRLQCIVGVFCYHWKILFYWSLLLIATQMPHLNNWVRIFWQSASNALNCLDDRMVNVLWPKPWSPPSLVRASDWVNDRENKLKTFCSLFRGKSFWRAF